MTDFLFNSLSETKTKECARRFARKLKSGDALSLVGDFGSGKTTFVKGLAAGLGVKKSQYVSSPSFVILKVYKGRMPVYHFDLYRLSALKDFEDIGLTEFLSGEGICVVEWADNTKHFKLPWSVEIRFSVKDENRRILQFSGKTDRMKKILKELKSIPFCKRKNEQSRY